MPLLSIIWIQWNEFKIGYKNNLLTLNLFFYFFILTFLTKCSLNISMFRFFFFLLFFSLLLSEKEMRVKEVQLLSKGLCEEEENAHASFSPKQEEELKGPMHLILCFTLFNIWISCWLPECSLFVFPSYSSLQIWCRGRWVWEELVNYCTPTWMKWETLWGSWEHNHS